VRKGDGHDGGGDVNSFGVVFSSHADRVSGLLNRELLALPESLSSHPSARSHLELRLCSRFREVESAETSLPGATRCAILASCLGFRVNLHRNEASRETLPAGAQGPLRLLRSALGEVERLCRIERPLLLVPVLSVENVNLPIRSKTRLIVSALTARKAQRGEDHDSAKQDEELYWKLEFNRCFIAACL
jgi:hypothetical protein